MVVNGCMERKWHDARHRLGLLPGSLIEKAGPWDVRLSINQDGEFFSRVLLHVKSN
jgi:hypothetical protein